MMTAVSLNKIEFVLQGLQRSSGANILALQNSFSGINNFRQIHFLQTVLSHQEGT